MSRGFSLIELLVMLALLGILGMMLARTLVVSNQANQAQREITRLNETLTVAEQLLQSDLRLLGYRGGDTFDPALSWDASGLSDPRKFSALNWLRTNWSQLKLNGAAIPTLLSGNSSLGGYNVTNISWSSATNSYRYDLQRTVYTFDGTTRQLLRDQDSLACDHQTLVCNLDQDSAPVPMIEGLEAMRVFFQSTTGAWSATPPPAANLARIGVYLRGRSPRPIGPSRCGPWPSSEAQLPLSVAELGITPVSYSGADCGYRRSERTLSVYVVNPQQY